MSGNKLSRNKLGTIFLIVFVDLLGFGLILPLLPFYAEQYGAGKILIGLLVASYAAAQFLGAPVLGRLSDIHGRRPILLLSIAGTAAGFVLLGAAVPLAHWIEGVFGLQTAMTNALVVGILFFSRILDGLTGGNISVAQAYITDITTRETRAKGLGLIGAAFGLGFIIGPAAGGLLSNFGFAVPAYAAAALATLNLTAVFFFLSESLSEERRQELARSDRPTFNFKSLVTAFRLPDVGPLFHTRFFFGLAFAMFQTIFTLYAAGAPLGLTPQSTGFVLTYVGVLAAIVQGLLVGRLAERYSDIQLIFTMSIVMGLSLLAWAFTPNLIVLLIVLAPLAFAGGVLNTVINSALTKAVEPQDVGGTLGISASLESLTRVIAPAVGGFLLAQFGAVGPGLFTALVMFWVVSFVWRHLVHGTDAMPPAAGSQGGEMISGSAG
ncbi:MAG: MFS transporter [Caldilineaceae bacterium]|nr:MFS transporter [Caldilineaceae bacterium]MCB9158419.1 MFS transporter [Caldilineaceae bacterium]